MLSHYYFFCSFRAQKYVHKSCVYIRVEESGRKKGSTIKKFPPIQHLFTTATYVLRNIVCCLLYDPQEGEKRRTGEERIISYKHEAPRRSKERIIWDVKKMQRGNLSTSFSRLQFRLLHHVWKDKNSFYFLVDASSMLLQRLFLFLWILFMLCLSEVFPLFICLEFSSSCASTNERRGRRKRMNAMHSSKLQEMLRCEGEFKGFVACKLKGFRDFPFKSQRTLINRLALICFV